MPERSSETRQPESAECSPSDPIVRDTRIDVTGALGIQIFPAERLLGPFNMDYDTNLARLEVAMRHYEPWGLSAALHTSPYVSNLTPDEETDAEFETGLAAIR